MVKRKKISGEDVQSIYTITQKVPVKLVKVDIPKALAIAVSFNIYAYDAFFIQSAISASCPILSLDQGLIKVARKLNISVLE